jgi:S-adenosylmethionine:tRNA ribosyltransferase-isomerase
LSHPRDIRIADYTYHLPEDRIAKYPLPQRDLSKLLIYDDGHIREDIYRNISRYIAPDSLVIFNDTKVVHARLLFPKDTGAQIEVFCLEPDDRYKDITTGMMQTREVYWKCLVGKAGKWKERELHLNIPSHHLTITATIEQKLADSFVIHLQWDTDATFAEVLHIAGAVPLPPYIRRKADKSDSETYQTIYSKTEGSVAAPTAGLHFTPEIFDDFKAKGIEWDFVTLHVGAGTFKPVKSEQIASHAMHAEWLDVSVGLIEKLTANLTSGLSPKERGGTAGLSQKEKGRTANLTSGLSPKERGGTAGLSQKEKGRTANLTSGLSPKRGGTAGLSPSEKDVVQQVIAVGTTAARTLESLYWLGVKTVIDPDIDIADLVIHQWDAYELPQDMDVIMALSSLASYLEKHNQTRLITKTQLLIAPGYTWRIVNTLITNFHQPDSTLLLLVAALIGNDWRKVYDYALAHDFRFLSYGDGCLLKAAI